MADEDELIGERYRLGRHVGSGAMGVVWQAEDERLRRVVAVKQVTVPPTADAAAHEQAHRRVMREGRMIARLHHPNAIAVFDVVEHRDQPWLVMEYLPSRSLAEVLTQDGPLAPDAVARLGRQVADALGAAHEVGMVHRDVKPGNVLLTDDGLTKVTDFGIARAIDDVTITSANTMAGTPAYLAPEVARGATADYRSDVYSLGSTLYAALEGAPPFGTADNALAVLHRVASGDFVPPRRSGPLTSLLERLLDRDPDRRPDMHQVRDELARFVSTQTPTERGPSTPLFNRAVPAVQAAPVREPVPAAAAPPPPQPTRTPTPTTTPAPVSAPETTPQETTTRRPHRGLIAAGVAVVLLVAAVVAVLASGSAGTSTGALLGTDDGPTATSSPDPTGTTAPSLAGTPEQQAQQQAIVDYYALLPDQLDAGWQRLTPDFQRSTAGGFANYRSFWSSMSQVTVRSVSPSGGDSVDATVTYTYRDGREVVERTVFRMAEQEGGAWAIDGSTVQSSR